MHARNAQVNDSRSAQVMRAHGPRIIAARSAHRERARLQIARAFKGARSARVQKRGQRADRRRRRGRIQTAFAQREGRLCELVKTASAIECESSVDWDSQLRRPCCVRGARLRR
jgi:hypothetical protein